MFNEIMENKIFYFVYVIGIFGLLLPFYENSAIGCGFETNSITFETRYLFQDFYENIKLFKLETLYLVELLVLSVVLISILFSPIFYIYKKYLAIVLLSLVTIGYFILVYIKASEMLVYGYYILLLQQFLLMGFITKNYLQTKL